MSEINYYSENSDVTWRADELPPFQEAYRAWRPGLAGPYERPAIGDGEGNGYFIYFLERYLVLEVWVGGEWQFTRTLDCSPLLTVGGERHRHLIAFGYDLQQSTVTLGVVSRDGDNLNDAARVIGTWAVPNLAQVFAHPERVHLGGMPVAVPGGTQHRTLDADVRTVHGRVCGRAPLTAGELARLSGRELVGRD